MGFASKGKASTLHFETRAIHHVGIFPGGKKNRPNFGAATGPRIEKFERRNLVRRVAHEAPIRIGKPERVIRSKKFR